MFDLFLYCDLAATHVVGRGTVAIDDVHSLLRLIDRLSRDQTIVVDLTAATADDATLSVLRTALIERADLSTFRVLEPLAGAAGPPVASPVTTLDAA